MRVVYSDLINTTVPDSASAQEVFDTLKRNFPELSNGSFEITGSGDDRTMRVFVKSGSKA